MGDAAVSRAADQQTDIVIGTQGGFWLAFSDNSKVGRGPFTGGRRGGVSSHRHWLEEPKTRHPQHLYRTFFLEVLFIVWMNVDSNSDSK